MVDLMVVVFIMGSVLGRLRYIGYIWVFGLVLNLVE